MTKGQSKASWYPLGFAPRRRARVRNPSIKSPFVSVVSTSRRPSAGSRSPDLTFHAIVAGEPGAVGAAAARLCGIDELLARATAIADMGYRAVAPSERSFANGATPSAIAEYLSLRTAAPIHFCDFRHGPRAISG